jgi:hypothetical protein
VVVEEVVVRDAIDARVVGADSIRDGGGLPGVRSILEPAAHDV